MPAAIRMKCLRRTGYRLILGEIYLQDLIGKEKPPLPVLFKNLPILLTIRLTASSRIQKMMTHVLENPHFDPDGFRIGHAHVILGLLFKGKNKRPIALKHLTEARRICPVWTIPKVNARRYGAREIGREGCRRVWRWQRHGAAYQARDGPE